MPLMAPTIALVLMLAATARASAEGATPCGAGQRIDLDLQAWRGRALAASDPASLRQVLRELSFDVDRMLCRPPPRLKAVDVFPASFGARADADRIVQIRMQQCNYDRDFVVLLAAPEGGWCVTGGNIEKGGYGAGCGFDPPIIRLVRLTDPRRDTLRIDSSGGHGVTLEDGAKGCAQDHLISFYDMVDGEAVVRLQLEAGPVELVGGGYPRAARAPDDHGRMVTYVFRDGRYQPEAP